MDTTTTPSLPSTLRQPPDVAAYTPLAEHQSRTPTTFFGGPPVLHYHAEGARAYVSRAQRAQLPWGETPEAAEAAEEADAALRPDLGRDMVQHTVDVFVGSDTLTLYCPAAACGVALPYPVIGLHAIKSAYPPGGGPRIPTVYMQLELGGGGGEDAEDGSDATVELSVVVREPAAASLPQSVSEASRLFDAISACADLHPDPFGGDDDDDEDAYPAFFQGGDGDDDDDDDEYANDYEGDENADGLEPVDGFRGVFRRRPAETSADLPPPLPGSGGWITAENAHEFFDEEGNWRGDGRRTSLGAGAGRVRGRDEVDAAASDAAPSAAPAAAAAAPPPASSAAATSDTNGVDDAASESKRLRTE